MTIRDLVSELANTTPTAAELAEREVATTAYLRQHLCPELTDADVEAGDRFWRELESGRTPTSLDTPERPDDLAA